MTIPIETLAIISVAIISVFLILVTLWRITRMKEKFALSKLKETGRLLSAANQAICRISPDVRLLRECTSTHSELRRAYKMIMKLNDKRIEAATEHAYLHKEKIEIIETPEQENNDGNNGMDSCDKRS